MELAKERYSLTFYHQKTEECHSGKQKRLREGLWNNHLRSKRNTKLEIRKICVEGGRKNAGKLAGGKTDWTP